MLFDTGNTAYGCVSASILAAQFLVVYARVLPYLYTTFGITSPIYWGFLFLGYPWGLLALDFL